MLKKPATLKDCTVDINQDYAVTTTDSHEAEQPKNIYSSKGWDVEGSYSVMDGRGVKQDRIMTDPLMYKDLAISLKPTNEFLGLMNKTKQAVIARIIFTVVVYLLWAAFIAYVYFWNVFGLGGWMPHAMNHGRSDGVLTVLLALITFLALIPVPFLMEWRFTDSFNNDKKGGRDEKLIAVLKDNKVFFEDFFNQFLNIRQVSKGLGLSKDAPKQVTKFWMTFTPANTKIWKEIWNDKPANGDDGYLDKISLYGLVTDGNKNAKLSIVLRFNDKYRKLKVYGYKLEAMED